MASVSHHFELQRLYDLFYGCISDEDSLTIDHYVDAYEEISKLVFILVLKANFMPKLESEYWYPINTSPGDLI